VKRSVIRNAGEGRIHGWTGYRTSSCAAHHGEIATSERSKACRRAIGSRQVKKYRQTRHGEEVRECHGPAPARERNLKSSQTLPMCHLRQDSISSVDGCD
jgi:hypothetical protein